jgi:hypothetical protein
MRVDCHPGSRMMPASLAASATTKLSKKLLRIPLATSSARLAL